MKNKNKYLLKNVGLFMISGFVPSLLSFILIPIYTSYLSQYDYGISDLITTTATLLVPIFTLDIQDAVIRYVLDKKYKKDDVFSIGLKIDAIGLLLVIVIASVVCLLDIFKLPTYFFIFLVVFYTTISFNNLVNLFCRGIDKVKNIVIGSIINSVITLSLNIIFLVVFKMGIKGYLLANSIGSAITIIYLFFSVKLYKYIKKADNKKLKKEMLIYSFPLIFSVIAWWINNASDRYIVTAISGVAASGLYAISYKIPSLLTVMQNIFAQAWSISAIKEFDREDTDGFIGNLYDLMNFGMCLVCSVIMIFNIIIAKMLYSNEFFAAWQFVPPLLISIVFNAMALFIGSLFTAVKDTKKLSVSTIIGAVVNIILNIILINIIGVYGAAIATMISYMVVLIIRDIGIKKYIKLKNNSGITWASYGILVLQMIFAYFGNRFIIVQCVCAILIVIMYRNKIKDILNFARSFLKTKK